jgi:hypothetical protein
MKEFMLEVKSMAAVELEKREQYYVPRIARKNPILCTDDRPSELTYTYIAAGGAINFAHNLSVMQETVQPGSVEPPLEDATASIVPTLTETACDSGTIVMVKTLKR